MSQSEFVFEEGEAVSLNFAVENDFVFEQGELISDSNNSQFAFIEQRGFGKTNIIDNFERNNINPYSGKTYMASTQGSVVNTGDYALQINSDVNGSSGIYSFPGDGLNYYPQEGDVGEFYVQHTGYHSGAMHIGLGDSLSGYRLSLTNVSEDVEKLRLAIYETERNEEDGLWNINNLVTGEENELPVNVWYRLVFELHPSKIVLTGFQKKDGVWSDELGSVEASISGYNGRGVAFSLYNDDATMYYDNARVIGSV